VARSKKQTRGESHFVHGLDGVFRRIGPPPSGQARKSFADAVDSALADQQLSASSVIDRIREALGCDSDTELAWIFGTSPQHIWNRRNRNTVPYREALFVSLWAKVSLEYLLTGRGSLRP
jgi:hypothetical protein